MNKLPGKTLKFQWPSPIELRYRLRDVMDSNVDMKYTLSYPYEIVGVDGESEQCNIVAMVSRDGWHDIVRRIHGVNGISPTVSTCSGGNTKIKVIVDE